MFLFLFFISFFPVPTFSSYLIASFIGICLLFISVLVFVVSLFACLFMFQCLFVSLFACLFMFQCLFVSLFAFHFCFSVCDTAMIQGMTGGWKECEARE